MVKSNPVKYQKMHHIWLQIIENYSNACSYECCLKILSFSSSLAS